MKVYQSKLDHLFYEKQGDVPKGQKFKVVEFHFSASPKTNFVNWMNQLASIGDKQPVSMVGINTDEEIPVDRYIRERQAKAPASAEPRAPRTADDVIGWVLDEALPSEIENLFAALGARFHEAAGSGA